MKAVSEINSSLNGITAASTFTAAMVQGYNVTLYQMGNSPTFVYRDETLIPVFNRNADERCVVRDDGATLRMTNFLGQHEHVGLDDQSEDGYISVIHLTLKPGDYLLILSDGYYDKKLDDKKVKKNSNEVFVKHYLPKVFEENPDPTPVEIIRALENYAALASNNDDRFLLVYTVK